MGTPFISEVKIVAFNYAPQGWAQCNGQTLPINQNQALFSLIGTMYGGNGQTTFQLPDLRGKAPLHVTAGFNQGQVGGSASVTLNQQQLPQHIHGAFGSATIADQPVPTGNLLATVDFTAFTTNLYAPPNNLAAMSPLAISSTGGSQPHNNMQPYQVLNYIIALQGVFPSRN